MALARTRSVSIDGIRGHVVEIEADIASGLPGTALVGSVDGSLSEARDRCRAAVVNSGRSWPGRKVTIALSPASLPKTGAHYDLAIAVAVLAAAGDVPAGPLAEAVLLGELALDGRLRAVPGVLPATLGALRAGCTRVLVPEANATEAAQVDGVQVVAARSLGHVIALLTGADPPDDPPVEPLWHRGDLAGRGEDRVAGLDLRDVLGQDDARFALEVAAAGGHHLLLCGPPGAGKTMLAERLPALLPDLDTEQRLEVSAIHSVAGVLAPDDPLVRRPPFVDPHHSASTASIVGGGSTVIRPGAASLAHHGVLFMDEAPEFSAGVLESLRQCLESGQVSISRARARATFPARFQLVLAMNPCPCGRAGPDCSCVPTAKRRYGARLSGPIRDRVDVYRRVEAVSRRHVLDQLARPEGSARVAARVVEARNRQRARLVGTPWRRNADVPGAELRRRWPLAAEVTAALDDGKDRGRVSARGMDRIVRLAWTLADLDGRAMPGADDLRVALCLRDGVALPGTSRSHPRLASRVELGRTAS
ncbi:MAG: YifB family Mg chelatase-like AAA ATPase [Actinomycetota bacterium]|nr:YifB family Mg chelatase-like AAA ATPase [Actinomycetota bacterium]